MLRREPRIMPTQPPNRRRSSIVGLARRRHVGFGGGASGLIAARAVLDEIQVVSHLSISHHHVHGAGTVARIRDPVPALPAPRI